MAKATKDTRKRCECGHLQSSHVLGELLCEFVRDGGCKCYLYRPLKVGEQNNGQA